ncbi:hypothetical protein P20495_0687 [Pseudoalteromonas sp. BSi20495]|nr:hypothetical protein P20495_0687 [Pseudoalteromonas sp. BSi20495]
MYMNCQNNKIRFYTKSDTNHENLNNLYDQYVQSYSKQATVTLILNRYGLRFDHTVLNIKVDQQTAKYLILEHLFYFLEAQFSKKGKR